MNIYAKAGILLAFCRHTCSEEQGWEGAGGGGEETGQHCKGMCVQTREQMDVCADKAR